MNQKIKGKSKRNKDAVEFILASRETNDPNFQDPNVPSTILLQVNKDEDLTDKQKELVNAIPKVNRGVFDEDAQLKRMLTQNKPSEDKDNKKVKFNFDKTNYIMFDKREAVAEIKGKAPQEEEDGEEEIITTSSTAVQHVVPQNQNEQIQQQQQQQMMLDMKGIENDDKAIDELFKHIKITAKCVEYNELGVRKDTDPEILKFLTNKEFQEGIDLFIPASKITEAALRSYDNDMRVDEMDDEYKELEKELQSDNEENGDTKENENENKDNELEDNFILLANEGELPIAFINQNDNQNEDKKKELTNNVTTTKTKGQPSYKYITKEEADYLAKRFAEEDKRKGIKEYERKDGYVGKEEFNDALNELLQYKKGNANGLVDNNKKKKKVKGLTKHFEDEDEFEEYESIDDDDEGYKVYEGKNEASANEEEDEYEEYETPDECKGTNDNNNNANDNDDDDEGYQPNIKIEYVSKDDEPDPFSKEPKKPQRKKQKDVQAKQKETEAANDDVFTLDDLNEITSNKDNVEKTLQLYNYNETEKEKTNITEQEEIAKIEHEIETKLIHEPKVRRDINSMKTKVENLPQSVGSVVKTKEVYVKKKENNDEGEQMVEVTNASNVRAKNETKEEKKLRKKLVKMERKEKRIENKKLKNEFKEEKKKQQKQIAETNKIIRSGLSVKDL